MPEDNDIPKKILPETEPMFNIYEGDIESIIDEDELNMLLKEKPILINNHVITKVVFLETVRAKKKDPLSRLRLESLFRIAGVLIYCIIESGNGENKRDVMTAAILKATNVSTSYGLKERTINGKMSVCLKLIGYKRDNKSNGKVVKCEIPRTNNDVYTKKEQEMLPDNRESKREFLSTMNFIAKLFIYAEGGIDKNYRHPDFKDQDQFIEFLFDQFASKNFIGLSKENLKNRIPQALRIFPT